MISLGQKRGMPRSAMGQRLYSPQALGHKVEGAMKNYLMNIKNQQVHHSPVEKFARSSNALGQYA